MIEPQIGLMQQRSGVEHGEGCVVPQPGPSEHMQLVIELPEELVDGVTIAAVGAIDQLCDRPRHHRRVIIHFPWVS